MVGVEPDRAPPVSHRRIRRRRREGIEEVSNGGLMRWVPMAVPDYVEVYLRSEDRTHVVSEVDQVGRALIVLCLTELSVWIPGKRRQRRKRKAGKYEEEALKKLLHLVFFFMGCFESGD